MWAICTDGPCRGEVFETDALPLLVDVLTDQGTFQYERYALGLNAASHHIAKYRYVSRISPVQNDG